jgi:actin-related protein
MTPDFLRLENKSLVIENGKKKYVSQTILDGEKGLTLLVSINIGDKYNKIYIRQLSKDKYELQETHDKQKTSKEINVSELVKILASYKDLEFIRKYISENKNLGGEDKPAKKATKKTTVKTTKKSTKKQTGGVKKTFKNRSEK